MSDEPEEIIVIYKRPGEDAYVTSIRKGLKPMQSLVDGSIEMMAGRVVGLSPIIDVWFNEEGKLHNMEPNLNLVCEGERFDILVGPAFFTAHNKKGETLELPKEFHEEVFAFCKEHKWRGR